MEYINERVDDTGFGDIRIIQREGLGYGVDAVLLASFAAGETGARGIAARSKVAELGSGNGIVCLILDHKLQNLELIGYEIRSDAIDRAVRSCKLNKISNLHFIKCDILDIIEEQSGSSCNAVVSNPPYFKKSSAIANADSDKYIARHETTAELGDFLAAASHLLQAGGDFYMVHRPDRLVDICSEMRSHGIEPKELQMVLPREGEAANIMLVHGVKGAGSELKMLPDIIIHGSKSEYSDKINTIYERRTR